MAYIGDHFLTNAFGACQCVRMPAQISCLTLFRCHPYCFTDEALILGRRKKIRFLLVTGNMFGG